MLDPAPEIAAKVDAAIREAGYEPVESRLDLRVDGMSCAACVGRVERALKRVPGVLDASANLATGRATIRVLDGADIVARAVAALDDAGYAAAFENDGAERADREQARRAAEIADLKQRVIIAAVATLPLLVLEMGAHMSEQLHHLLAGRLGEDNLRYIAFLLASIVLFGPGRRFLSQGLSGACGAARRT